MKRFAAHRVVYASKVFSPGFLEIEDGYVVLFQDLKEELPNTIWKSGTIEIKESNGRLAAYYNQVKIE